MACASSASIINIIDQTNCSVIINHQDIQRTESIHVKYTNKYICAATELNKCIVIKINGSS